MTIFFLSSLPLIPEIMAKDTRQVPFGGMQQMPVGVGVPEMEFEVIGGPGEGPVGNLMDALIPRDVIGMPIGQPRAAHPPTPKPDIAGKNSYGDAVKIFTNAPTGGVSCGQHHAPSCEQCPAGRGASYCNGQCQWDDSKQCIMKGAKFFENKQGVHFVFDDPKNVNAQKIMKGEVSTNAMDFMNMILGPGGPLMPPPFSGGMDVFGKPQEQLGQQQQNDNAIVQEERHNPLLDSIYEELSDDERRSALDQVDSISRVTLSNDACGQEMVTICKANRTVHCLATHHEKISDKCKELVKKTVHYRCISAIKLHCDGLDQGLLQCLRDKKDQVTPDCRDSIDAIDGFIYKMNNSPEIHLMGSNGALINTIKSDTYQKFANHLHFWKFGKHRKSRVFGFFSFFLLLGLIIAMLMIFSKEEMKGLCRVILGSRRGKFEEKKYSELGGSPRDEHHAKLNREYGTCI